MAITITTEEMPRRGILQISPSYGRALFTTFSLDATTGWATESNLYPLSYHFFYSYSQTPDITWPLGTIQHDLPVLRGVRLPCGHSITQSFLITVEVCDRMSFCTHTTTEVVVECPSDASVNNWTDALTEFYRVVSVGNSCKGMTILGSFIKSFLAVRYFPTTFKGKLQTLSEELLIKVAHRYRRGLIQAPIITRRMVSELYCVITQSFGQRLSMRMKNELALLRQALIETVRLHLTSNKVLEPNSEEDSYWYFLNKMNENGVIVLPSTITMVKVLVTLESMIAQFNETEKHTQTLSVVLDTLCKRSTAYLSTVAAPSLELAVAALHPECTSKRFELDFDPVKYFVFPPSLIRTSETCLLCCVSYVRYSSDIVMNYMQWLLPLDKVLLSPVILVHFKFNSARGESQTFLSELYFQLNLEQLENQNKIMCYFWKKYPVNLKPCKMMISKMYLQICKCETETDVYIGLFKEGNRNMTTNHLQNYNEQTEKNSDSDALEVQFLLNGTGELSSEDNQTAAETQLYHILPRCLHIDVSRILRVNFLPSSGVVILLFAPDHKEKSNKLLVQKVSNLINEDEATCLKLQLNEKTFGVLQDSLIFRYVPISYLDENSTGNELIYTISGVCAFLVLCLLLIVLKLKNSQRLRLFRIEPGME
ncbi:uncharacterized protein LOC111085599 isoform X3 [Limulus polyphemus]|uniref:Uncharacterized protein LOC111085599 isoform X3 n=1 Tax=Limulus polyphemus TaxID=6850 RepID=A0ABM1SAH3_LIMPO|nr:uncharacterized protein LOC111085599 isoform X3 [Limulus polyphemus]